MPTAVLPETSRWALQSLRNRLVRRRSRGAAGARPNKVDYVLAVARNSRLVDEVEAGLTAARIEAEQTGQLARCLKGITLPHARQLQPRALDDRQIRVSGRQWGRDQPQSALRGYPA